MDRWERLAPLTGIAAVALFAAEAIVTGHTPAVDAPAQETVAYFRANSGVQEIAACLFGLSAVAYVWFGASLRAALRDAADGATRLGSLAQAGTLLIATGLSIFASFGLAAAHSVDDVPATTTQTLNVLNGENLYMLVAVGTTLMAMATALSILRHGGLPRWLGWVSLVLAVVAVAALVVGAFVPGVGFVAFLLLVLWIPTVAILIYRGQPVALEQP
ncbi:MAG: hypothetical protein ABI912_02605 [Actinomycetota bacterium]